MGERATTSKIRLGLALQGGGAYGAFTRGALIRLLDDPRVKSGEIEIVAVTGTSAGAVNGAALVAGLNSGGPQKASQKLRMIWDKVAQKGLYNPLLDTPFTAAIYRWPNLPLIDFLTESHKTLSQTADFWMSKKHADLMKAMTSLSWIQERIRTALNETITAREWDRLRDGKVKLFINSVVNGRHVTFKPEELRAKRVVDSAALNFIAGQNQARDGAYRRNPDMEGIEQENITDLLVITLHGPPPVPMHALKQDADEPDAGEIQTYHIHKHLTESFYDAARGYKLHEIAYTPPKWHKDSARLNTDPVWLEKLTDAGYRAADYWLSNFGKNLGRADTYIPPKNVLYKGVKPAA